MKATGFGSSGIVHQVLTKDNYERWRVVMQNYLEGQGLWDVVQSASEVDIEASKKVKDAKALHVFQLSHGREILETAKKSWNHLSGQNGTESKATPDIEQGLWGIVQSISEVEPETSRKMKDAKALHIIQLSCGREILDEISHFDTAKEAWNHLSKQYGKELKATRDTEQAILDDSTLGKHKMLFRKVERGDDIRNIRMDSDVYVTSASGRTLLHVAVIAGNVENVEKLVKEGKDKLVRMQDDKHSYTALALAAHYTGNTDIAKCMVESKKGEELLVMENKEGEIPVLLAAANGHKEMTAYLYSKTPQKVFKGEDPRNRVLLLARCITAEIFDVALGLLKRYPDLPRESLFVKFSTPDLLRESSSGKFSVLDALAKMPSVFPSGRRFGRPEQLIYDLLNVEREFRDNYGIHDIANFVQPVTPVVAANKRRQKTSFAGRCIRGFRILVFSFLFLPLKLFGLLLRGIAYLLVQFFKCLNIFGIRKIYDRKYTHYEVLGILNYFCQSIADFNDLELKEASAYGAMLHAAQHGIVEFINTMREANPDLLSAVDSCHRGVFSYAVLNRKQNVFQLMHYLNGRKEIFRYRRDAFGNNLLHLAAHLGPSSDLDTRSGAALQMQREIQWFKARNATERNVERGNAEDAVEEVVHPKCKEAKNSDRKKPHELFTDNHEELVKAGEKWAKETATSFTIVGTLITTIMFAAAFTVPGGNNQETGMPIFLHDKVFTTFLVADAVSLFTSATSVLIFIGILTSRYAERDFLKSLPWKLLFGLTFLFLSVCSMIVAFCAAIDMMLKGYRTYRWSVVGPTLSLGSIPIIVLVVSQLRLMFDIFQSTWKNPISSIKQRGY